MKKLMKNFGSVKIRIRNSFIGKEYSLFTGIKCTHTKEDIVKISEENLDIARNELIEAIEFNNDFC